jgi:uncharacterized FlaG/YvyC family protein
MTDDYDYFIKRIDRSEGFGEKRKRKPQEKKINKVHEDEVKDHFEDLTQVSDRINKILQAKKSLNRFCIYRNNKDIFIDLVILDDNNKITKTIKRNITHKEFTETIKNIEELDGFIVDFEV